MGRLGGVLGSLRASWVRVAEVLEVSCVRLGPSWSVLGTSWDVLARLGCVLSASWEHPGGVLEVSCDGLGASWASWGGLDVS